MKTFGKYILEGKKIVECNNLLEWAKWMKTADKVVKQVNLSNGFCVSTVFLGLERSLLETVKPLLFETMVFDNRKKGLDKYEDLDLDRCSTWEEAEKMHKKMVKKWKKFKVRK